MVSVSSTRLTAAATNQSQKTIRQTRSVLVRTEQRFIALPGYCSSTLPRPVHTEGDDNDEKLYEVAIDHICNG